MIQHLIKRYKQMRSEAFLRNCYTAQYAFIGLGNHSLTNLYPVLQYLQVPLRYICVTSEKKRLLVEKKYQGVRATTSIDEILNDKEVKAVFVATSPSSQFGIAKRVLEAGKALFVEKPPCSSLEQLDQLIAAAKEHHVGITCVGLQKRYAPAVVQLCKVLKGEKIINYDLHYQTGLYPEGNALLDLYIHPLDLVTHLFGSATIVAQKQLDNQSLMLMLQHKDVAGTLELSTNYSWLQANESLHVCTNSHVYDLEQMETLTQTGKQSSLFGVPMEKVHPTVPQTRILFSRNNFTPILANNQIYTQGFFGEIKSFVDAVEHGSKGILTSLSDVRKTFEVLFAIS